MKRDDHVCVVWCILYPMTCSFVHTTMLNMRRTTTYPRAQPQRTPKRTKGSKRPSKSTKQPTRPHA